MIRELALALASIGVCTSAAAAEFNWNGFSTVGYTQLDTDEAEYAHSTFSKGVTNDGDFEYGSILGLQGAVRFNDEWSVVAQGLLRQQVNGNFEPNLDWAYVKWAPRANAFVRAGITRVPTFYLSDTVFLSYSMPWVRAPIEVYGLSPVYLLEGIDASWTTHVGPVRVDVQGFYGDSDLELYATSKLEPGVPPQGSVDIRMKDWAGLIVTAQYASWTFRASYSDKRMQDDWVVLQPLQAALQRFGYADLARRVGFKDSTTPIIDLVVHYDDGTQFVLVEAADRDSDSIAIPHLLGGYITAGRRFGSLTPYVSYAELKVRSADSDETIQVPASSPYAATLRFLDARVDAIASFVGDQETLSAGLRYELPSFSVLKGAVIKGQVDRIDPKDGGKGFLSVATPGFSDVVHMYSLNLEVLF